MSNQPSLLYLDKKMILCYDLKETWTLKLKVKQKKNIYIPMRKGKVIQPPLVGVPDGFVSMAAKFVCN